MWYGLRWMLKKKSNERTGARFASTNWPKCASLNILSRIWFQIYDAMIHWHGFRSKPFSIRFNLFSAIWTKRFSPFHFLYATLLDATCCYSLYIPFHFATWNFKKRLYFCIKYASCIFLFLLLFCVLFVVCSCCFVHRSFRCFSHIFFLFFCMCLVERERINCKTIQFIQKCFIFLLCATMSMTTKQSQSESTQSKTKKKSFYSAGLLALLCRFPFSFFRFSAFHFVVYYLFFLCVSVCVWRSTSLFYSTIVEKSKEEKNCNAWITFALFYTIQTQSLCNSG